MRPIDIEPCVACAIASSGITSSAMPLPRGFEDTLPFALVTRTGGYTHSETCDAHMVSVDVYAETWTAANDAASKAVSAVRSMVSDGSTTYDAECNMPYPNHDPRHETLPRVTFTATLTAAGKE